MSDSSSPYDASQSALGYLHQCQYALLLGLQRDEEPNLCISIEKLDDIAFHESPSSPNVAKALLQVKHHLKRAGGLGDASPDIWKTLKIWSEAVTKKQIDLDRATLCLLTTTTPTNRNAIRNLTPAPTGRKPEEGRTKLEKAGASSTSDTIKDAYAAYMALPQPNRIKLFNAIYCQRALKTSHRGRNQKQPFYRRQNARLVFINTTQVDGDRAWRMFSKWQLFKRFYSYTPQNGRSGASHGSLASTAAPSHDA